MIEYGVSLLLLFGGRSDLGKTVYGDVWRFNSNYEWELLDAGGDSSEAPVARFGVSSAVIEFGYSTGLGFVIFGGEDASGQVLNDTWAYFV